MNIRVEAARVIEPLLNQRGSLKAVLPPALERCPAQDRPLLRQLCYGTLRDLYRLEAISAVLLKRPFKPQDRDLQALLLVGLYQLRSMRIPAHAAVSETVQGTRDLQKEWAGKLFNAVLRRFQREQADIETRLEHDEQFQWNHPSWMIDKLRHNWPDHWQSILKANDIQGPLTLRVNKRLLTRDEAIDKLSQEGFEATPCTHSPHALTLSEAIDIHKLPGFDQGFFSVQDEAAQLACALLDAQPGERILDACAAPGGKLCHLLETQPSLAEVIAVEMEPSRLERVRDNLERLKLSHECVLHLGDASAHDWWNGRPFDRILVDAPCSGTGVIRRNPDIKLLRRNEDILALANLQLSILENLWGLLAPGGRLVYATCSLFPQENERIVERFVKLHADARTIPVPLSCGIERPYGRQLFPVEGAHDGFYYAILTKDA
ncbi:Ribosomal RNA small subunit methyltransferase B [Marinobacterium lacunae]|uniref:16S rRNA (cytosine(967)-C(5))-methyltransferase n=1 Tax=Marinobacterium lacunae TaxID=1232683 RepID=A0A081FVC4_9GAMM|nr:16S rRNA (cytosine(967)-C(5))-methyltransferase RsmB [Marinobacterium lacunae]KEA62479.1 Ribosomal RNA small subunit methyltransferase B [Marinobacterium lacunae]MBR9882213.1 16S rRNA (cytosine(967)-C(5))-methyltransferase RsmB [Oceanospirillales bacterium]